ncbi:MAG: UDP-N-acetylmuramate--alanine ligase [Paludibacteraceae bacterium]|jgi:UDP-N-acetylmuramate--alanine ligase|nr:UDP-N-acetylmuramate--alanine ligase [Paludibacteraceae bacterium]MED9996246.1 Mur ligase family protein [Paludibacteraceae bacterium]
MNLQTYQSFFFVGIAGTGMSAIAQYLRGCGKTVSGSDRLFASGVKSQLQCQFEDMGIGCYVQDGSGIDKNVDLVVVSTAIEESNVEYQKALSLNIPIAKRSAVLAAISDQVKTIAIGGTSGKSTTTAMVYHILQQAGLQPSLITGAGLTELQEQGLPGNAYKGQGEWLVIEADESDGSIVGYHPEIAVVLNVERDHKEADELMELFGTFKQNTKGAFVVNADNELSAQLSANSEWDFSAKGSKVGIKGSSFKQSGFSISFKINGSSCKIPVMGQHNMENALAAFAICTQVGVEKSVIIKALATFKGIYRRTQLVGTKETRKQFVIDDFAHNPQEVAAAIAACQLVSPKVVAYFQPHGFGPLRFMHAELSQEVAKVLRPNDYFLIGDVYYAGGTVDKNISPTVVSTAIIREGKQAVFVGNKQGAIAEMLILAEDNTTFLIMGARDPQLDQLGKELLKRL